MGRSSCGLKKRKKGGWGGRASIMNPPLPVQLVLPIIIHLDTMERSFKLNDVIYLPDSLVVSCDFDNGLCFGWSQSKQDVFDWTLYSGRTSSSNTGPSSDHTSGSGLLILKFIP